MSSLSARLRAAVTALGVVLTIAVVLFLVVALGALAVGYVWGTVFPDDDRIVPPSVEFETELDDGTVTIEHVGGDTVDPADLVITVGGEERGTWEDFGGPDTVAEGSTVTVDTAAAGDTLEIDWVSGEERWTIAEESL